MILPQKVFLYLILILKNTILIFVKPLQNLFIVLLLKLIFLAYCWLLYLVVVPGKGDLKT